MSGRLEKEFYFWNQYDGGKMGIFIIIGLEVGRKIIYFIIFGINLFHG
jgi:hypothetical protein